MVNRLVILRNTCLSAVLLLTRICVLLTLVLSVTFTQKQIRFIKTKCYGLKRALTILQLPVFLLAIEVLGNMPTVFGGLKELSSINDNF